MGPGPQFALPFGGLSANPILTLDPEATQTAPSRKSGPKPAVARRGQVEQTRWADLHERLLKKKKKSVVGAMDQPPSAATGLALGLCLIKPPLT